MKHLKVNGEYITDAGIIVKVLDETKTRLRTEIVDVFFPVHETRYGKFQIDGSRAEYLRDLLIGQKREFWKAGTRFGYEVGGNRWIQDWAYDHEQNLEL